MRKMSQKMKARMENILEESRWAGSRIEDSWNELQDQINNFDNAMDRWEKFAAEFADEIAAFVKSQPEEWRNSEAAIRYYNWRESWDEAEVPRYSEPGDIDESDFPHMVFEEIYKEMQSHLSVRPEDE